MTSGVFTHELAVRFRDCDAFGHVNNAVYLTYLEEARTAWFLEKSGGPESLRRFPFILANVHIDFRSPARFPERLAIDVRVGEVRTRSFALEYVIRAADREVARASSVQVTYDYEAGTPIPIPDDLRRALE